MKPKSSDVWQYFETVGDDYARCKICNKNYSRKGRTTTSLKGHLKAMHKEQYAEFCQIERQREIDKVNQVPQSTVRTLPPDRNQSWDTSHTKARKIDNFIGEMIALQNLPFNFVEGIGFRRLMETALPNYQLRDSEFFKDHICEKYIQTWQ